MVGPDRDAAAPRRAPPHHRDAAWPRAVLGRRQEPGREAPLRPSADCARDRLRASPRASAATIQDYYRELAADEARNRLIINDVISAIEEGRSPILLTERKDHLKLFADALERFVRHLVVLQGGMSKKAQKAASDQTYYVGEHGIVAGLS